MTIPARRGCPTADERVAHLAAERALEKIIHELGYEELVVLGLLARRLHAGQTAYGLLHVENDPRDYRKERGEELADALIYTAMDELRRLTRRETTQ
jgi:hypothetical protein